MKAVKKIKQLAKTNTNYFFINYRSGAMWLGGTKFFIDEGVLLLREADDVSLHLPQGKAENSELLGNVRESNIRFGGHSNDPVIFSAICDGDEIAPYELISLNKFRTSDTNFYGLLTCYSSSPNSGDITSGISFIESECDYNAFRAMICRKHVDISELLGWIFIRC